MSVIAVKIEKDKIIMSGDSQFTKGRVPDIDSFSMSKLWKHNGMIVGTCGAADTGSLFWHFTSVVTPHGNTTKDIMDYILDFSDYAKKYNKRDINHQNFILVYKGKCFYIENLLITEINKHYAIGSGGLAALAVLHMGGNTKQAVKIACELDIYCSGEILTEHVNI